MFFVVIRMIGLFGGLLWATNSHGWDGYQIFMWCNFTATCAINWVQSNSGYCADDLEVIFSSGGGVLALGLATWLLWPIVGEHLPGTWLGFMLKWSGILLGLVYGGLLLMCTPVFLMWLVCKLAPDSNWAYFLRKSVITRAERAERFSKKIESRYY